MVSDFIVVGAGAYGCAVAYHLSSAGATVTVLEQDSIGEGASGGYGKRGVRGNRRDARELPLMAEAYELWPHLAAELGSETGYTRTGGLILVEEEVVGMRGGRVAMQAHAIAQTQLGVPTETWNAEQVRAQVPQASDNIKGALYAPLDGSASHSATTQAYAEAARCHGTDFHENTKVIGITAGSSSSPNEVTTSNGQNFAARNGVLLATNSAVPTLLREHFNLRLPAWMVFPQAILIDAEHEPVLPFLTGHDSRVLSVKLVDEGKVMVSGGWRGALDPHTGRGTPIEKNVAGNIAQLSTVFPGLGNLQRVAVDTSRPETATFDQIPFIDKVPGTQSVYFATGWSGHGWALLPAASKRIAQLVTTGEHSASTAPFSLDRINMRRL
ncbi:NAD(P)/FAD-dependent oxidoreductase [Nesterenkonia ebinurensis]|uniref:NAD(P)/FAD-dependent oxidoreductase n=1 Tax=Nesterenkonia ebinurensis TaxID=2608252 RepID=UPI00168AC603|nr:FAD-binding oxidoreductase [Nesterenkonia ebinurensis]